MGRPKGSKNKKTIEREAQLVKQAEVKADPADELHYPELWGMKGHGAITEVCPNCAFAYADGGYCPECGWSKPVHTAPYGTYSGKRYDNE